MLLNRIYRIGRYALDFILNILRKRSVPCL